MFRSILLLALQVAATSASTVVYNWNIEWATAAPDGFHRPVISVNGQWPCPAIEVNIGSRVILNVVNRLQNETTAVHFHGLFQTGSSQMDGPARVAQCPISPGSSFTYNFTINQPGTYWYHAHIGAQYIDGFRGPIIRVLTVEDWYHEQAPLLLEYYQSPLNEDLHGGAEPVPNATLINGAQNIQFPITPGRTYLFRIINIGSFAAQFVQFEEHDMTIVEMDGVYTKPYKVSQLFLTAAQRYTVLVKAKPTNSRNFAIVVSMPLGMFAPSVIPSKLNNNATAYLVYDNAKSLPEPFMMTYQDSAPDDLVFAPYDPQPLLDPVTVPITFTISFGPNNQNQNRAYFNNISFTPQKVPTLYTALSAPPDIVNDPKIYGPNSNPYVLPYGAIVQLTVINTDSGPHPFHLHSHDFQVLARSPPGVDGTTLVIPSSFPGGAPMRRDTILIYGGGAAILRFKVDNPGISLFHCHIEWHVEAGLTATFIEAPTQLQQLGLVIPRNHKETCYKLGIPMSGNAAGNTDDWTDLRGANTEPPLQNWGALVMRPRKRQLARRHF
ncbi:Multicopper oxidase [Venustampulla echinocandica]|uniref:Multicopper oxidase n=1 Tax=Venustampulla echinocandica TaxID=2656787 RepID=A0A370TG94_9HELO|nr:Multicopper oxidase [Venustampulla echinocandica]RDL33905.1 Multicopper oxidase [Venustampulla echinocandica]